MAHDTLSMLPQQTRPLQFLQLLQSLLPLMQVLSGILRVYSLTFVQRVVHKTAMLSASVRTYTQFVTHSTHKEFYARPKMSQCFACVAVCCSVLQRIAAFCSVSAVVCLLKSHKRQEYVISRSSDSPNTGNVEQRDYLISRSSASPKIDDVCDIDDMLLLCIHTHTNIRGIHTHVHT